MDEYQPFDSKNKNEERYDSLWHTTNINFEIFKVYHHDADDDIFLWKSSFPNIVQNFIHIHAQSSYRNDEMLVGVYSWYDLTRRVFPKQGNVINFVQISLPGKKSNFFSCLSLFVVHRFEPSTTFHFALYIFLLVNVFALRLFKLNLR